MSVTTTIGLIVRYRYRRLMLRDALDGATPTEREKLIKAMTPILRFHLPARRPELPRGDQRPDG